MFGEGDLLFNDGDDVVWPTPHICSFLVGKHKGSLINLTKYQPVYGILASLSLS